MSEWLGLNISRQDHADGSYTLVSILPNLHRLSKQEYAFNPWTDHHEQIKKHFRLPRTQENIVEKFRLTTGVMQNPLTIFSVGENFALIRGREGFTKAYATLAPQYLVFGDIYSPKGFLDEYWAT